MQSITKITIPQPCHQVWNEMTERQNGRFCSSCAKTVVDFTTMSNQQIIDHLSTTNNVCGRLSTQQFEGVNYQLRQSNLSSASWWKRIMLAATLLISTQYVKGQAVTDKPATEQLQPGLILGEVAIPGKANIRNLTGKIIDDNGEPLSGVTIIAGDKCFVSNAKGDFNINIPVKIKKIGFSYIGFEYQLIKIDQKHNAPLKIILKVNSMMLGGLGAIRRKPTVKELFKQYLINPVKTLIG